MRTPYSHDNRYVFRQKLKYDQKEGQSLLIKRHISESLFSQDARRVVEPTTTSFVYTTKKGKSSTLILRLINTGSRGVPFE